MLFLFSSGGTQDLVPLWTGVPCGSPHGEDGHFSRPGGGELSLVLFQQRWWAAGFWKALSPASGFPGWKLGQSWRETAPSALVCWPPHPLGSGTCAIPSPAVTVKSLPASARSWVGPSGSAQGYCLCLSLLGLGWWWKIASDEGGWQADLGLLLQGWRNKPGFVVRQTWV